MRPRQQQKGVYDFLFKEYQQQQRVFPTFHKNWTSIKLEIYGKKITILRPNLFIFNIESAYMWIKVNYNVSLFKYLFNLFYLGIFTH